MYLCRKDEIDSMQRSQKVRYVIYTDLDGSLLDHDNYSYDPATELLAELEAMGTPVIFASSKTASEIVSLQNDIENRHPFIAENGAAVYIPSAYFARQPENTQSTDRYWVKTFSRPKQHWISRIKAVSSTYAGMFRGFSEMQIDEIAELTGLDHNSAKKAADRSFSEPVYWYGDDKNKQEFVRDLRALGCHLLQGGRFLHVSDNCDKGRALRWLQQQFAENQQEYRIESLAIGDSQNDVAMLDAASHALIIRSPAHPPPQLSRTDNTLISQAHGPKGWVEGVTQIIPKQYY